MNHTTSPRRNRRSMMFNGRLARTLFAGLALAALTSALSAQAEQTGDITVTLPRPAATALHNQLADARPPTPLEALGLEGVADFQPVVPVPMRDGVRLSANIILLRGVAAQKLPVILIRTPYAPTSEVSEPLAPALLSRLVRSGYAVVIVNDRGTQWSEGRYQWLKGANQDGYDILDWITQQAWSNGKVGTFGCSSSAESQPPLAMLNHPAHKVMVEMAGATGVGSIPGYHDQGIFYHEGVPDLAWAGWYQRFGLQDHPILPTGISQDARARVAASYSPEPDFGMTDFFALVSHLPTEDILRASGIPKTEWDRLIRLTPGSPEWNEFDFVRNGDSTRVPGLHIDSWYDAIEAYPTVKLFQYLSSNSPNQHLVMGPTAHCRMGTETAATSVGDREVGDGRFDYVTMIARWFDRWLKDDRSIPELPPVQYYVLNSSQWKTADSWPPRGGHSVRLFLSSDGHANSLSGDGRLRAQQPTSGAAADEFVDDPLHPVPSLGGSCCSDQVAREQSGIEARQDVLVYSSDPFVQTTRIVGDVNVTLFVTSSAPDTDFMVKLLDVDADGHAYNLTDTAVRMRYRNGYGAISLMQPGQAYSVKLTGMVTATDLLPGHRLRIEVASTNFPNYERNLNTGGNNFDEILSHSARNRVLHSPGNASVVEFTVLPR
jgi:putative CocE/NonD family hydrolase